MNKVFTPEDNQQSSLKPISVFIGSVVMLSGVFLYCFVLFHIHTVVMSHVAQMLKVFFVRIKIEISFLIIGTQLIFPEEKLL